MISMVRTILISLAVLAVLAGTAPAATIDNDASCDISVLPAATLLLILRILTRGHRPAGL
jgi:hypothetical protein